MFKKFISLLFLISTFDVYAQSSPCENKNWLQKPVLDVTPHEESGIGGTGVSKPANSNESLVKTNSEEGIGGTGIVGVITGFGSICVNGTEVEYNEMTPIFEDGQPSSKKRLGLGQTVSVLASPNAKDYDAKEIRVLHEVQGKIEAINSSESTFTILEQTVHLPNELLEKLSVGEAVAVSGNRLIDNSIEALRVEPALLAEKVNLIGTLEIDAHDNFYIGKQFLKFSPQQAMPAVGDEISVQGVLENGILQVEHSKQNPRWDFSAKVEQILVQGYVRESSEKGINIDGVHISPDEKMMSQMPQMGERTSVWVKETNEQHLILEHFQFAPQLPEKMPERSSVHEPLYDELHDQHEPIAPVPNVNHLHSEMRELNFERNFPVHPEISHIDVDKPTLLRLNVEKPEIGKTEKIEKPMSHPEVEKPTISHPEIEKPSKPEIEHPKMMEKPTISRPDINQINLPNRK